MIVYKIRHKDTGLYSKGGSSAITTRGRAGSSWGKYGKTWSSIAALKFHLNIFKRRDFDAERAKGLRGYLIPEAEQVIHWDIPAEWEIVAIEVVETATKVQSAREFLKLAPLA